MYGFLKPHELAYSIVENFVDRAEPSQVAGELLLRDGLPLLTSRDGTVEGYLLHPKMGLYDAICHFEPRAQYRWSEIETRDRVLANVLLGRSPLKGSTELGSQNFNSREDIVLADGPRSVRRALERSYPGDEVAAFFEVQMAYLLLWSIIERFMSLRYGPWLEPAEKVTKFGSDPLWTRALETIAADIQAREIVVDARDPDSVYRLDASKPLSSLEYFYQFRCNLVHRGKAAMVETVRLERAANQLMHCMKAVWAEIAMPWTGDDPEGEMS